jgi:sec-independent protein translocase protein TatA
MGSIGPGELLVIALIALLLFGAGRIADIGKGLGQGIRNFKEGLKEGDSDSKEGNKALTAGSSDKKEKEA